MRPFTAVAFLLLAPVWVQAQNQIQWKLVSPGVVDVVRGSVASVKVAASIQKGWHVYSMTQKKGGPYAMSITLASGSDAAIAGAVKTPAPASKYDAEFKMNTETYSGNPVFSVPVRTMADHGTQEVMLKIRYQACSDTYCIPPRNALVPVKLHIVAAK